MEIKIKQHDITDCGAACLASVSSYYNLKIPIAKIRQYASTDKKGTNVLGMINAAEKLGFSAKGVRGELDSLTKIPLPAIAHVIIKKVLHHFVVIYKATDKQITVMDPGDGKMHKYTIEDWKEMWTGVLIIMAPNEDFTEGNEKIGINSRFMFLLKPHRSILIQALFGAVIYTVLGLSTSIYIQKITDNILIEGNYNLLNLLSVGMILILVLQIFISVYKSLFILKTGQKIDAQLILGYYKHLLTLPQRFFDTMRTGEIISRINDAVKIRVFINDVIIAFFVNVFIIIFSFILMFTYYWKLSVIILLIIPFHLIIYLITNRLNKKTERKLMEKAADLESQLVESLNNVKTIKQFGIERYTNLKTENRFVNLLNTTYTSGLNFLFSSNSTEFINRLFVIIVLWVGSYFVIDRNITPGELLSFYAIIGYFTSPISSLVQMNKTIQNALIASDRLFEIMDLEKDKNENKIILSKEQIGDIVFKDVDFSYGTRVQVFDKLSLKIEKGKFTAIVGESGSGKTTLMTVLQRLYPITSGHISIGEFDISHIDAESLKNLVSVVPQEIHLFSGSIIDNIALGDFNPDMNKILNICISLGITDFIKDMPGGFETHLGEHGVNLSGGQRQRIAIARALYKNPEIIILDEATSSLDSISEYYVQETISDLKALGKTIIVISHRLSTNIKADNILILENGKLIEQGNHRDLLSQKGKYFQLWTQQMSGTQISNLNLKRIPLSFSNQDYNLNHYSQHNYTAETPNAKRRNYKRPIFFILFLMLLISGIYIYRNKISSLFDNLIITNEKIESMTINNKNNEINTKVEMKSKGEQIQTGKDSLKSNSQLFEEKNKYLIQVGKFRNKNNANRLKFKLKNSGYKVISSNENDFVLIFIVCSNEKLETTLERIRLNYDKGAFIVK